MELFVRPDDSEGSYSCGAAYNVATGAFQARPHNCGSPGCCRNTCMLEVSSRAVSETRFAVASSGLIWTSIRSNSCQHTHVCNCRRCSISGRPGHWRALLNEAPAGRPSAAHADQICRQTSASGPGVRPSPASRSSSSLMTVWSNPALLACQGASCREWQAQVQCATVLDSDGSLMTEHCLLQMVGLQSVPRRLRRSSRPAAACASRACPTQCTWRTQVTSGQAFRHCRPCPGCIQHRLRPIS